MTSPVVTAKITIGDIDKLYNKHWAHLLHVLRTVSLPPLLPLHAKISFRFKICWLIFLPYASNRSKFNSPPLVCVESPVNAIAALFEVIKPRKGSENSETVSWKQTYSSKLSFSWSDSRAAQFYRLKRLLHIYGALCSKIERVFLNKNASKWVEREHCVSRVLVRKLSCCVYCVKKMTSQSNCLVFLVTRPKEHGVV